MNNAPNTEHRQTKKDLKDSEERFRTLADAAFEALIITENGKVLEVNRTYTEVFGYEPEEIVGKNVLEKLPAATGNGRLTK